MYGYRGARTQESILQSAKQSLFPIRSGLSGVVGRAAQGEGKKNKPAPQKKPGRTMESYKKLCSTIADFIGYDPENGQPMPTIVFRRLKELDFYSDEIIQQTMDENEKSIRWAMQNKKFEDDAGKCSYLMAIIRNNIGAVYRREKDKAEKTVKNNAEPNLDTMIDLSMIGTAHKGKDVSSLLGGDDLWI